MLDLMSRPWPWYVAGPVIGALVPALLLLGGKRFGVSSSFTDVCAAVAPGRLELFRYDWRENAWRLAFVVGIVIGGAVAATALAPTDPWVGISAATMQDLRALGLEDLTGLVPRELISWRGLATVPGFVMVVLGGFLVGFGARYAGGCTSGHGITGLASLRWTSLVAVLAFFAGGLVSTHVVLPLLLGGAP